MLKLSCTCFVWVWCYSSHCECSAKFYPKLFTQRSERSDDIIDNHNHTIFYIYEY